jgi:hypothetical protein
VQQAAEENGDIAQLLRLDCQHNDIRSCRTGQLLGYVDAEIMVQLFAPALFEFYHADIIGCPALGEQSADDGTRHVAAADEADIHGIILFSWCCGHRKWPCRCALL